jgi:hypothetical protein
MILARQDFPCTGDEVVIIVGQWNVHLGGSTLKPQVLKFGSMLDICGVMFDAGLIVDSSGSSTSNTVSKTLSVRSHPSEQHQH